MDKNKRKGIYTVQPTDLDIKDILASIPEAKQGSFLRFIQFVKNHTPESSKDLVFKSSLFTAKKSISILVQEFEHVNISEIEIWNFLLILKTIYDRAPKPSFEKGILSVNLGLPNLEIITGPDDKKYVTGLDNEVISRTHKILLKKYGEKELVVIEKI